MKREMRWLSMILAAVMVLSLAACGGSAGTTDTNTGKTSTTTSTPKADAPAATDEKKDDAAASTPAATDDSAAAPAADYATAEEILSRDFSTPYTIEYAGVQLQDGNDNNHGNAYDEWWSSTFNVEWDATSLTFENWAQRMNTWLNADDIPEWCVWNFNAGDAINYVDQDILLKLPDGWKEKYPNLAASQDLVPAAKYYEEMFGGTYFIFRPVYATNFPADVVTSHYAVNLRKDWAEQAGYDLSKNIESNTITLDEFIAYNQAVKDAGIIEYPFVGTTSHFISLAGMTCEHDGGSMTAYYKGEDGKYHWGPAEESSGVKAQLTKLKQMYDNGLVYPEFYTILNDDDQPYFHTSAQAASICGNGMAVMMDRCTTYMRENLGLDYWEVGLELVLTDENGVHHGDPSGNYWGCNIISPYIDEDKLERLLTIWDFDCTEYGQMCVRMGVPEVDWTYDDNGELVNLLEGKEGSITQKYDVVPIIYGNMVVLSDDFGFVNPAFDPRARQRISDLMILRAGITTAKDKEMDWDFLSYSSQALNLASMNYADEYANLITKSGDFSANYDQWVQEKMALVQPVLDDLNSKFAD